MFVGKMGYDKTKREVRGEVVDIVRRIVKKEGKGRQKFRKI